MDLQTPKVDNLISWYKRLAIAEDKKEMDVA